MGFPENFISRDFLNRLIWDKLEDSGSYPEQIFMNRAQFADVRKWGRSDDFHVNSMDQNTRTGHAATYLGCALIISREVPIGLLSYTANTGRRFTVCTKCKEHREIHDLNIPDCESPECQVREIMEL